MLHDGKARSAIWPWSFESPSTPVVSKVRPPIVTIPRALPLASVSLVIRDGEALVPERRTVLRQGDDLLVVTPRKLRDRTEARLRQVSSKGRLAQWLPD